MKVQITLANGNIMRETTKAIAFDFSENDSWTWMPKSQIELDIDRDQYNAIGTLTMPIWLAKEKGFWGYDCYGKPMFQMVE